MSHEKVIVAENLSKLFRIGCSAPYKTLRETLVEGFGKIFRRGKQKKSSYQDLWALKNVSFEVNQGDIVGIIGHNGSGKSTLLKILSKITEPTEGAVTIRGRVGALLEVGTGFHPELTGRENVFLNGSILGMTRSEILKKFDEIVAFAEVEQFLDTPVKFYSSGMYTRLAFSVAAHFEPEILIIDEVLAVGDLRFQKKCLGKMEDTAQSGKTVLFVSHNIPAMRNLCNKGILLSAGQIQDTGAINDVLGKYLEVFNTSAAYKKWSLEDRPGNHSLKFNSIGLTDLSGKPIDEIHLSDEFALTIDYEIVKDLSLNVLTATIYVDDGSAAMFTLSNQEEQFHGKPMDKGTYRTICRLPSHLFNDRKYFVSISCYGANWSDLFILDRIISFEPKEDGLLIGDYFGKFDGVFRPRCKWTTQVIG